MKQSDLAELFLLALLWGGSFLLLRIASPALGPIWLIEWRVLIAGLALLPLLAQAGLVNELRRHWRSLFVVGCLNSAIPFVLLSFATLSLPAGLTSIFNATAPLFGMVIAFFWLKEPLTPQRLMGLALGFGGVVLLVGVRAFVVTPSSLLAVGAALTGALMYAIAAPFAKRRLVGVSPMVVTTGSQLSAAAFLVPALPFTVPAAVPSEGIILAVLILALVCTSAAYLLYFRLIRNIGSTNALMVTYLVPLFAMVWGFLVLREPVTISMVMGSALILLGTAIANGTLSLTRWAK
jgi:drug/metabolite transporter (DMT)-like permease